MDDGKSTLLGRLLHDLDAVPEDHLQALCAAGSAPDLAHLTDGLKAEREQGITLDVAYRHLRTPRRRVLLADTPGHEEYTRNMITGASTADAAIILVDVRTGACPQTRRHATLAWLLGIRAFAFAVNKMDLVGFDEVAFRRVEADLQSLTDRLAGSACHILPVCALDGDGVVHPGTRMPWHVGPTLLGWLEALEPARPGGARPFRFPVQTVVRDEEGRRHYLGQVASGTCHSGEEALLFPGARPVRVARVTSGDGELPAAQAGDAVALTCEGHFDIGRGDLLASTEKPPLEAHSLTATLAWMDAAPLALGRPLLLRHTTRQVLATPRELRGVLDLDSLAYGPGGGLGLNDIGRVALALHQPVFCDAYAEDRGTGSFVLIDPLTHATVAAGLIEAAETQAPPPSDPGPGGLVLWLTGLSSAGKTTLGRHLAERLQAEGHRVEVLDGDVLREGLCRDLGFSRTDRDEHVRRLAILASLLARHGVVAIVCAISPYREAREAARAQAERFVEVHVAAPLEVCEARDVKGLYRKARAGLITQFTGVDDPYEPPLAPEVVCRTDREDLEACGRRVLDRVRAFLA